MGFDKLLKLGMKKIDNFFKNLHMTKCGIDSNLYYQHYEGKIMIVTLYVDDLVITGNSEKKITWLKGELGGEFKMTNLGQLGRYLGIIFICTRERFLYLKNHMLKTCFKC
jgi:hypothetical protein